MSSLPHVPATVTRVADLMSSYPADWALCGGWAIDAWLGRVTREHGDIDIIIFHDDQQAIFEHLSLAGWHLIAHDARLSGSAREPWNGRPLELPAHVHGALSLEDLHAWVPSGGRPRDGVGLEVVFNERSHGVWMLNPEPQITLPWRRCFRTSPWGLPTAEPKILLFYKATAYVGVEGMKPRPHDEADFRALAPRLEEEEREWLRESIALLHPDHAWLPQLSPGS